MCRRKGLCVVLALCLLLATVLVPPAGVLAAPADAAGDTVSTGADGTVPGLTDAQETASVELAHGSALLHRHEEEGGNNNKQWH